MVKDNKDRLTLLDAIHEARTVGAVATAIEKEGIYTRDKYGRFIHAELDSEPAKEALRLLAEYETVCVYETDEEGHRRLLATFFWHDNKDPWPYRQFFWPAAKIPDFETLRDEWNQEQPGDGAESEEKSGVTQRQKMIRQICSVFHKEKGGYAVANYLGEVFRTKGKTPEARNEIPALKGGAIKEILSDQASPKANIRKLEGLLGQFFRVHFPDMTANEIHRSLDERLPPKEQTALNPEEIQEILSESA